MVHLILTGATGLIGSSILSHILSLPSGGNITRLSILTRNPTIPLLASTPPPGTPRANQTTRIEVIQHADFSAYPPELLERLQGADACIWALGVSQSDVDADTYVRVTRDFALEAAKAFSELRSSKSKPTKTTDSSAVAGGSEMDGANGNDSLKQRTATTTTTTASGGEEGQRDADEKFKFIYVSGEGATLHPRAWTPIFGRVKGETEAALLALSKTQPFASTLAVYSVRPAAVDGHNQPWLWRDILNHHRSWSQRMLVSSALPPIRWASWAGLARSWHSPTEELGRVLVEMAVDESRALYSGPGVEGEGRTLGNIALRRLAREKK
ncbi:hypothetical protein A1O1_01568 [Capronia coronata CBS 617.96]|uniref:NAD(P)-binding domain-containing protein n=1 Tax=Capronia coronata CBS 617.96 TaxID=1182541 RepID=W9YU76_9EURO|nr:uncharacterized protein A1O1_01568 [Capronia coronata CBS 617.96]EXJ96442.1 hypothetical protein A1O1_01568 [Capronia coronata CBS 617.96]